MLAAPVVDVDVVEDAPELDAELLPALVVPPLAPAAVQLAGAGPKLPVTGTAEVPLEVELELEANGDEDVLDVLVLTDVPLGDAETELLVAGVAAAAGELLVETEAPVPQATSDKHTPPATSGRAKVRNEVTIGMLLWL